MPATGAATEPRPPLIMPHDPGYDDARRAWNLAVDQRPAAIVEARSADDVTGAIALAGERDLRIAPQATGHLAAALPDLDGTLLLRTAIGGVEVDPARRRARIGAGVLAGEVAEAAAPHGLAVLSGSSRDVGVVGYTLGGGLGWLGREKGLACNHVRAIELVAADGRLVRTDAEHEPDLFWALRGGGGNFGVVTALEFDLFPIAEVFAGMTVWPAAQAREVLGAWAAWAPGAPGAVATALRLLRLPPLPEIPEPLRDTPVVVVDGAALAEAAEAAAMLEPFRAAGTPMLDTWGPMPPAGLLEIHMDPPEPVPGLGDGGRLLGDLDDAALDAFLGAVRPAEVAPLLLAELRQLGGALARAPQGAGARGALEGSFVHYGVGMVAGPEQAEAIAGRLGELAAAMRPWETGSRYLNFAERGGEASSCFDAASYERLRAVRGAWDPDERFVASHRIAPD